MQRDLLDNFLKEVNTIEKYIEYIGLVEKNLKSSSVLTIFLKDFSVNKKIFEYRAVIISLYGILENTISIWIQEHVKNITKIVGSYNDLEKKFRDNHFLLSIKLISLINESRYSKYETIDKECILNKLHDAIKSQKPFELNHEAYIPMSGNLKHSKIVDAFKPLEVDFKSKLNRDKIKVDDLVSRRNDIAHGEQIDELLDISMFQEYIDALKSYMIKIFESIIEKELEYQSLHNCIKIDAVHSIHGNYILCFRLNKNSIRVGDTLIIKNKKNIFFQGEIINIEKDGIKQVEVETDTEVDIGIELVNLSYKIKKNQEFFIKKRFDT